jgi:DNA-binding response OmpR family regulator
LVADSYEAARQACARYLVHFHFNVLEAASGDEALAAIAAQSPHVVLTDSMLPTLATSRFGLWLRQNRHTRDIPVIVLADDAESARSLEAAAVLVKPFSMAIMIAEVRRVLRSPSAAGAH